MCFELPADREKRIKDEAAEREARIRKYEQDMGVQLPYSPVAVLERPMGRMTSREIAEDAVGVMAQSVTLQREVPKRVLRNKRAETFPADAVLRNKPKSRADYMKKYRKKPKMCPHCGKNLKEAP